MMHRGISLRDILEQDANNGGRILLQSKGDQFISRLLTRPCGRMKREASDLQFSFEQAYC